MNWVTPEFIEGIIERGPLSKAQRRTQSGSARPQNRADWAKFTSWTLICEEISDTEHDDDWYDDVIAELSRRGFSYQQIDVMRRFAWATAGWLNYDRVLWEWGPLGEEEIKMALERQLKEGLISQNELAEGLSFMENPFRHAGPQ